MGVGQFVWKNEDSLGILFDQILSSFSIWRFGNGVDSGGYKLIFSWVTRCKQGDTDLQIMLNLFQSRFYAVAAKTAVKCKDYAI